MAREKTRVLTVRISEDEYQLLRSVSYYSDTSMNELSTMALRLFLSEHARAEDLPSLVRESTTKLQAILKRLSDD